MLNMFLTIACSTSIALILKFNDVKKGEALVLLAANYLVASVISLIFVFLENAVFSFYTILFGLVLGLLFVLAFFSFTKAVSLAGTALATVSSRLSVIVPFLLSIIIYREIPTSWQTAGIFAALITIYLFYLSVKNHDRHHLSTQKYLYLLAVLLGIGINDFAMKIFEQQALQASKPWFLFSIFTAAFLYCTLYIALKKIKYHRHTFITGAILGVPNVFSTYFLLGALAELPAVLVFPFINIGIIVATAVLAMILFRERLNVYGYLSVAAGIIAIVLLSN